MVLFPVEEGGRTEDGSVGSAEVEVRPVRGRRPGGGEQEPDGQDQAADGEGNCFSHQNFPHPKCFATDLTISITYWDQIGGGKLFCGDSSLLAHFPPLWENTRK